MTDVISFTDAAIDTRQTFESNSISSRKSGIKTWGVSLIAIAVLGGGFIAGPHFFNQPSQAALPPAPAAVTVSSPVQRDINKRLTVLGQFSAVDSVELRAQVGGTLTQIGFKDGDIVHKGDLLFQIDPTPYQIRFREATATLAGAKSALELARLEASRADSLQKSGGGTTQNSDQKAAQLRAAQASVDAAEAAVSDAQFDLDQSRIVAPFTGRIGTHQVSIGNLIAGSRAATSQTTLLGTIVSTDTLYLNFDMSENDYMAFLRERRKQGGALASKVKIALADEKDFNHFGTLDFVDNTLDRSSGTIHARATVLNADGLLTPGGFARVRVAVAPAAPALLVPDAAVLPDQSEHVVLTVDKNNLVTPRHVEIGDIRDGLRVIRSGLDAGDRVITGGIPSAHVGATVEPHDKPIDISSN